jgi:hypothetical protein
MKAVEFCYWLQGYFELSPKGSLDKEQVECIRNHLNLVFQHEIDPSYGEGLEERQEVHDGVKVTKATPLPGRRRPSGGRGLGRDRKIMC